MDKRVDNLPVHGDADDHGDQDRQDRAREPDEDEDGERSKGLAGHPILLAAGGAILALALIAGGVYWLHERHYETTDDAFIDARIVRLAPQVAGRVTAVMVNDNQTVTVGQPLVTIDSADAEAKVAEVRAQLAQARAGLDNARAQITVAQANLQQAEAQAEAARVQADDAGHDLDRYLALQKLNPAAVARQQLDDARTKAAQAAAQHLSAVREVQARAELVEAAKTQAASGDDQLRAAQAQLDQASNSLSYARIVAPIAGHIAQETVAVGDYVQPGTQLLAIVPFDIWVTANFKETQLALMRPGQKVSLEVDACPDAKIDGRINSIQRGAGQAFSILPAENATGNYVKVVQRVPVKIVFDHQPKDCPLGPGMSVEPQVTVR